MARAYEDSSGRRLGRHTSLTPARVISLSSSVTAYPWSVVGRRGARRRAGGVRRTSQRGRERWPGGEGGEGGEGGARDPDPGGHPCRPATGRWTAVSQLW